MSPQLRNLIVAVVALSLGLAGVSMVVSPLHMAFGVDDGLEGLLFWTALTMGATMFPVLQPRGAVANVAFAPILASVVIGGPTFGGAVAFLGTLDMREVRGQVPWYGTLYNHSSALIGAVLAGFAFAVVAPTGLAEDSYRVLLGTTIAGFVYLAAVAACATAAVALRHGSQFWSAFRAGVRDWGPTMVALIPLSWLMVIAFEQIWYVVVLVFAIPLYTTRAAYQSVVEIRKMFTQTIKALASAIDARDPSTKKHSENVSTIAMEIGEEMGVSEADLESLQWGGLLHDVGKIGIPDAVLLKPSRLNKEERMAMNAHPEKGRDILQDVEALAPILPVILHHHQWYNGSGYPKVQVGDTERALIGEEIPLLARILHVADAFEAMTAVRPYRPNPMGPQQAIEELRKYAGIQFDPKVVEAFAKTATAQGEWPKPEPEPVVPGTPIPMLGQVAKLRSAGTTSPTAEPS